VKLAEDLSRSSKAREMRRSLELGLMSRLKDSLSAATSKANHLPGLASYVIRPALAEAKLMTEKHARDAVYVA